MDQIKNLNELNLKGSIAKNWKQWLQKFELYLIASGFAATSERLKCATCATHGGRDHSSSS